MCWLRVEAGSPNAPLSAMGSRQGIPPPPPSIRIMCPANFHNIAVTKQINEQESQRASSYDFQHRSVGLFFFFVLVSSWAPLLQGLRQGRICVQGSLQASAAPKMVLVLSLSLSCPCVQFPVSHITSLSLLPFQTVHRFFKRENQGQVGCQKIYLFALT